MLQPVSTVLFLSLSSSLLAPTAAQDGNLLTNPSFETGDISPRVVTEGAPTIVSDTSDDGDFTLQLSGANFYHGFQQFVSDLVVGHIQSCV
jgi:hypothetical protein